MLRSTNQKDISSAAYNFSINTNLCKMITVDGLTTYTFEVIRTEENGFFENLVVSELANGTFETKIYRYNVTLQEKQNILNGIDVDMTNKISTILIDDPNFVSDIFSKIYFSTFCYESSTINIPAQMCAQGIHYYGMTCSLEPSQQPQPPSTQIVYTMVLCPPDEGGGGGSEPIEPTDTGGSGSSTSPTGGGGPPEFTEPLTPCDYLISLANPLKQNIVPAINNLKNILHTNNPCEESGYDLQMENIPTDLSNYIYKNHFIPSNANNVSVNNTTGLEWIGLAHIHPIYGIPMFSYMDVKGLLQTFNETANRRKPYVVNLLVAFNGSMNAFPDNISVYVIKIDNVQLLQQKIDAIWNNPIYNSLTLEEKIESIHQAQIGANLDGENYEKAFLNFTSGFGISLYRATSQDLKNWTKLSINSTTNNVQDVPCNP